MDIWVGIEDGLLRRVREVVEAEPVEEFCSLRDLPGGSSDVLIDFFDHGNPIEISVPENLQ